MTCRQIVGLIGLAIVLSSLVSCFAFFTPVTREVSSGPSAAALPQLADAYRKSRPVSSLRPDRQRAAEVDQGADEDEYRRQLTDDLRQHSYDELEKEVQLDRTSKARFKGAEWKLLEYYGAVGVPATKNPTEDDWKYHISLAQAWADARPQSAAAQIALAEAYEYYGNFARGEGYANSVTRDGWRLYDERYAKAALILADAAKLNDKGVDWFEAMQQVGFAQSWTKLQMRKLVDDTIAFEPEYYHIYREYGFFLLPKWFGKNGEAEAFAEEISNQVGGKEGQFLYFEIASLVTCQCDSEDTHLQYLSWPKIKQGYAALGDLYGYSNLKDNRFALMAVEAGDRPAAQPAFALIGDNEDLDVWRSDQKVAAAKAWAAQIQGQ